MENKDNQTFNYTYSAKEQKQIKAIRDKYTAPEEREDKLSQLRRLDESVTKKASAASLAFEIIGALILGFGMSLVMTELAGMLGMDSTVAMLVGVAVGIVGMILVALGYPVYCRVLKKER